MTKDYSRSRVLVTGVSGFIGLHCVVQLLKQGYRVRGTLRNPAREAGLRQIIAQHVDPGDRLDFVMADLLRDDAWNDAVNGCEFVLHLASPFPYKTPADENELLVPAIVGTQRVLNAAAANNVKRVVLTSSLVAILRGHDQYDRTFDERDWTNPDGNVSAYAKSKTLAERAAWDFVNNQDTAHKIELSVINPGLVLGPLLDGEHLGTSAKMIRDILAGEYTDNYRGSIELVDVRDVASCHVAAIQNPKAAGKRFCCLANVLSWAEVISILDKHFSSRGYRIRVQQCSNKEAESQKLYRVSNVRLVQDLGVQPRPAQEAVVSMGNSLIQHSIV